MQILHFKELLYGNLLLLGCCAFYLLWWIIAFKPGGPHESGRTGLILVPAFLTGIAAIYFTIRSMGTIPVTRALFASKTLLIGGVAIYIILLLITSLAFKRQVTTELLLIIGWAVMAMSEVNVIYGAGQYGLREALIVIVVIAAAAAAAMVCYMLYYGLSEKSGYIDGMLPLIIVAVITVWLAISIRPAA
mgnify:CR=1 FL=1